MRNLLGLIIILLGIGFLLQQLNIPGMEQVIESWWPIIIIAAGLVAWSTSRGSKTGPMIIILVGAVMLLDQLDILSDSAWTLFWPIILIVIGARIIMGRSWSAATGDKKESGTAEATALFSGVERSVTGSVTKSDISAMFGGVKLDLRQAQFEDDSTLNIFAAFGGIELVMPKHVKVVTKVMPLFGGADDKTAPDSNATKTLTITGLALFGGVSIKN